MNIQIKEAALNRLKSYTIEEGKGIRIDAEMSGGCSSTVDIHLALSETRKNDTVIEAEGIPFFIDRFTQRYVDEELFLDYDSSGFTLYSTDEIFSKGLTIYTDTDGVPNRQAFC